MTCARRSRGWLVLVGAILSACVSRDRASPRHVFEAFFEEAGTVALEEAPDDPIVGVTFLTRRPEGGYLLTDGAAGRVHVFDRAGELEETLGGPGSGPGELRSPTGAVQIPDGRVFVAQRADPRLTVFPPGGPPLVLRLPGFYGSWLSPLDSALVVMVGTREERFAVVSLDGEVEATFGRLDPVVNETPYWIWFAREHAAVLSGRVVTNTSFFPTFRVFDARGDSVGAFGTPPPSWVPATAPPLDRVTGPDDRDRLEAWAGTFTVVRRLAPVADSLVVVQYGRHRPTDDDPYFVAPSTLDVYTVAGRKLVEDLPFTGRIVGGSGELVVLTGEPPEPWTVTAYRWKGLDGGAR